MWLYVITKATLIIDVSDTLWDNWTFTGCKLTIYVHGRLKASNFRKQTEYQNEL